jgi:hypothetical protein
LKSSPAREQCDDASCLGSVLIMMVAKEEEQEDEEKEMAVFRIGLAVICNELHLRKRMGRGRGERGVRVGSGSDQYLWSHRGLELLDSDF